MNKIILKLTKHLILFSILFSIGYSQDYSNLKRNIRVAIFSVDDKVNNRAYRNLKDIIKENLLTELVKSQSFTVVDRQQMESLLGEQGFQQTGIVSDQTAVQVGKILGIQLGIFGSITKFEIQEETGEDLSSLLLREFTNNKYKLEDQTTSIARLTVDLKIIDIESGEITMAEKISSSAKIKNSADRGFTTEVISKSASSASESIIEKIVEASENIPWSAAVTNVIDSKKIVINAGSVNGVEKGLIFNIEGKGEEIIDPSTGISLGFIPSNSGKVIVINSELGAGKASMCEVMDGKDFTVNVGDFVTIPMDKLWTLQYIQSKCPDIGTDEVCKGSPFAEFTIRGTEGDEQDDERWWWEDQHTIGLSNYDKGSNKSGALKIVVRNGYQVKIEFRFETKGDRDFYSDVFPKISLKNDGILEVGDDYFIVLLTGGDQIALDIDDEWSQIPSFMLKSQGKIIVKADSKSDSIDDEVYITLREVLSK